MDRNQASSFDPELFEQVTQVIAEQLGNNSEPDLEAHITGEAGQTEEEKNILNAQFCYEFLALPLYPLFVQSMMKMEQREHKAFEDAETDPGDRLRTNWRATQKVITEILGNIESGAEYYRSSLK